MFKVLGLNGSFVHLFPQSCDSHYLVVWDCIPFVYWSICKKKH